MKKKPVRTKSRMVYGAFRLKEGDRDLWIKAAAKRGDSLSEFVRVALRERATQELATGRLREDF